MGLPLSSCLSAAAGPWEPGVGDRLPPLHTTATSITSDFIDPCWVLDRNRALSGIVEDVFLLQIKDIILAIIIQIQ